MASLPEGGRDGPVFPRPQHWLIAAALLFVVTLIVPVMAGLV
ncbi:MAG TPA: hypothetical protein VJ762_02665 [Sphingobium sp.]|nr:hypothetical protein [Sphingobium sp.]